MPESIRQPKVTIVAGSKYSGKTYATLNFELKYYIKTIGRQQGRPVLILDVQGEYSKYKAISYNVNIEDDFERCKAIRKIKKPNIYRLLARHPNGILYSTEQIMKACIDITLHFKNSLFLMEDLNRYMTSQIPKDFYAHLISIRHAGTDLVLHYQRISDPPPRIIGNAEYLRLHKTSDSVTKRSVAEKYPNPELIRIAELIINKEYFKGNKFYFIYIDIAGSKLLNISTENFEEAMRTYLYENHSRVSLVMRHKDKFGNNLFKNQEEAVRHIINQNKQLYLITKEKKDVVLKKQP